MAPAAETATTADEGGGKRTNLQSGGLALAFAKLFFLIAGYAISIVLTRLVPPETFGLYGVISMVIAVPNMVLIQTVLFTVSRPLAAEITKGLGSYRVLRRRGFRLGLVLGGLVTLVFLAGAEPLAVRFLRDPDLIGPLRAVAAIPLIYALYAVNIGTLNATRRFGMQAALDIVMAASKASLIIGAAAIGLGLAEILGGFTLAAGVALVLSVVLVRVARPPGVATAPAPSVIPPMTAFAGSLLLFTAVVNLLLASDLLLLKRFVVTAADEAAVGFYTSANLVARVPYSLMNAVSLMMFPLVATLHALEDAPRLRRYVAETAKVTALLLCLLSGVAAAASGEIQRLLFPAAYGAVASELKLMVWGFSGYSFAVTCAWILNSTERSRIAVGLVLVPLIAVGIAATLLVPGGATMGAATAVAIAGAAAAAASLGILHRVFRAHLQPLFILKLAAAIAATELLGRAWAAEGKIMILAKLSALTIVFVGVILASRAVTIAEVKELRRARTH
ncbi:MAG: oligosaccharide flippase family protein [Myxococcales bacterium]|nr:oligosaccharide flippase family protein [Myxococcales bacterium]